MTAWTGLGRRDFDCCATPEQLGFALTTTGGQAVMPGADPAGTLDLLGAVEDQAADAARPANPDPMLADPWALFGGTR